MDFGDLSRILGEGLNKPTSERTTEVSVQLLEMGQALLKEGKNDDNIEILHAGNLLVLISGLMVKPMDIMKFSDLAAMYSAKQILDDMMTSPLGGLMAGAMGPGENFEGIDKIIAKMRKENGESSENEDEN